MTAVVYLLAFIGLVSILAVVGVWLLIPQDSTDDVDVRERLEPYKVTNIRVHATSHDPATCDACAGLDRSGF